MTTKIDADPKTTNFDMEIRAIYSYMKSVEKRITFEAYRDGDFLVLRGVRLVARLYLPDVKLVVESNKVKKDFDSAKNDLEMSKRKVTKLGERTHGYPSALDKIASASDAIKALELDEEDVKEVESIAKENVEKDGGSIAKFVP